MSQHHHVGCHTSAGHTAVNCYCHCCYTPCHHLPPPPSDPHLHYHHPPPQPQFCTVPEQAQFLKLNNYHSRFEERFFQEDRQTHHTVSSLLRRIAALESILHRRSYSSAAPHSLRDAAARTIQKYFRTFLLRRSRTLRQLKDLASIKSRLSVLKSSVSENTYLDYDVIYQKAVGLLLKLDTVQGGDPMIRDGKSSIRRELNKFLDYIDGVYVERRPVLCGVNAKNGKNNMKLTGSNSERLTGNVEHGAAKRVNAEKLRGLIKRIDKLAEELDEEEGEVSDSSNDFVPRKHGVLKNKSRSLVRPNGVIQPKVKKSVSFADDGKIYSVLRRNYEPNLDEDSDKSSDRDNIVNNQSELNDDLCQEIEEFRVSSKGVEDDDEEEAHSQNGGSRLRGNGEKDSRFYSVIDGRFERERHNQVESEKFIFSPPLPAKMEARADFIDKKNKIAT